MKGKSISVVAVNCGDVSLNCVCHRIHACERAKLRWHRLAKSWVNNRNVRSDLEVGKWVLNTLLVVGDDAESSNFSACARCARDRAEVSLAAELWERERNTQLLKSDLGVLVEAPHGLGGINRATTTDRNDPVGLELLHRSSTLLDGLD